MYNFLKDFSDGDKCSFYIQGIIYPVSQSKLSCKRLRINAAWPYWSAYGSNISVQIKIVLCGNLVDYMNCWCVYLETFVATLMHDWGQFLLPTNPATSHGNWYSYENTVSVPQQLGSLPMFKSTFYPHKHIVHCPPSLYYPETNS